MKMLLAVLSFSTIFSISLKTMACSCLAIANVQQAASHAGTIVAKVSTLQFDEGTSVGSLKVHKLFKGALKNANIKVAGQDGANCSGPILEAGQPWVAVFSRDTDGKYHMAGCADSSLTYNKDGKILTNFSETIAVTEETFTKLVNLKIRPTITGLACTVSASRSYVANDQSLPTLKTFSYSDSAVASTDAYVELSKDFSAEGLSTPLKASADVQPAYGSDNVFTINTLLTEPFHGVSTRQRFNVNIFESTSTVTGLSSYTDALGKVKNPDSSDGAPFYANDADLFCDLNLGQPLVPLKK